MGYFSRYQSPYAPGVDPRTGQPLRSPLMATPAPGAMPWDMAGGGQGFADMYAPQPKPMAPARPGARPPADPFAPLPPMAAQPQIQQSPLDPIYGFEGQTGGGQQMPMGSGFDPNNMDPAQAAYDPSMLAYMPQKDVQEQPGDQATGQGNDWLNGKAFNGTLGGMTGDLNGMDMLSLGLSLLGNSQNGGDWGQVGKDLVGINQGVQQRKDRELSLQDREREIKRQEEADKREQEQFDAWRKEQALQAGINTRYEEALGDPSLDPDSKRLLGILGPKGYGQYEMWRAEQSASKAAREEDRAFTASENAKNRAASAEEARIRAQNDNSIGKYFQAMDAETIGKSNAEAAQIQSRGLPMLNAVKADIEKARELGLQRGMFDSNQRITMGRLFNENGPMQTTLETWRARVLGPALETLRGLGAMSEREMEAAINSFSNPDMTMDAAMSLLNERISLAENKLIENRAMNEFFTSSGGLTGKRNPAGQDWNTTLTLALEDSRKQRAAAAPANPTPAAPVASKEGIPFNAITYLKQNPTPELKRQFDQKYGVGAADRVLGSAQSYATNPLRK